MLIKYQNVVTKQLSTQVGPSGCPTTAVANCGLFCGQKLHLSE